MRCGLEVAWGKSSRKDYLGQIGKEFVLKEENKIHFRISLRRFNKGEGRGYKKVTKVLEFFFYEKLMFATDASKLARNLFVHTSSLTHVHRFIGYHNPNWQSLPKSARLTYLSVYDRRDRSSESTPSPSTPSSFTYVHIIQTPTLPTPTLLTFTYTQVLWFLSRLTRPRASGVTTRPTIRITTISVFLPVETQCMRGV